MSLKKAEKPQDVLPIRVSSINTESQKIPAECRLDWCDRVIANPLKTESQPDGRIRHWGIIAEADNRVLRVVTLDDGETIHNAFFDRNFRKQLERKSKQT